MIQKIEQIARQFRSEADKRTDAVLASLRKATENTADFIASGKSPIRKIADTGLRLNRVSHKGVEKLVKNQASLLEYTLDDGAARLKLAARADSFRALVGDQIASLPGTRERAIGTARKSLDIVVDTGTEMRGIVQGAIEDLRTEKTGPQRVSRKPAAKKASATRKRVAKKTRAAAKPAAKKASATRKRVSRKARAAGSTAKTRARRVSKKARATASRAKKASA
jgi:phasin family protein